MAWTGNDGPRRSRDELFAHVVARGATLRRRRRAAMATLASLVVVVLVLSTATLVGRHGGSTVVSASGDDTTSSSVAPTNSSVPAPSTAVPVIVPPTTVAAIPSTSVPPTSVPKTTPTTAPRAATTTTTVPVDQPLCEASDFVVTVTFDQPGSPPSYRPGQTVTATATLRNIGPGTCYLSGGGTTSQHFTDSAGQDVSIYGSSIGDPLSGNPALPFRVGVVATQSDQWNQQCPDDGCPVSCPQMQCLPGTYFADFGWGLLYPYAGNNSVIRLDGSGAFQLVAAR